MHSYFSEAQTEFPINIIRRRQNMTMCFVCPKHVRTNTLQTQFPGFIQLLNTHIHKTPIWSRRHNKIIIMDSHSDVIFVWNKKLQIFQWSDVFVWKVVIIEKQLKSFWWATRFFWWATRFDSSDDVWKCEHAHRLHHKFQVCHPLDHT